MVLLSAAGLDRLDGSIDRRRDFVDVIVETDRVDMVSFSSDVLAVDDVYDGILKILKCGLQKTRVGMVVVLSKDTILYELAVCKGDSRCDGACLIMMM